MANELITVEYAGPAPRQVGSLPWHDVRAWWTVRDERSTGLVKTAAGRELKKHITADHVEFVHWDMSTYNTPDLNALLTFRVLTHAQFTERAQLRGRVYRTCGRCGGDGPGQLVMLTRPGTPAVPDPQNVTPGRADTGETQALCHSCWRPVSDTGGCRVLHWINRNGRLDV